MSTPASTIIERIRKALSLAADRTGTPEGETAARIARNMMTQHAISMADIDLATSSKMDPLTMETFDLGIRGLWTRTLMNSIAIHCSCRTVNITGTSNVRLYGFAHDVAVAQYLFEIIKRQIIEAADRNAKSLPRWMSKGDKRSAYNDFVCSAVQGAYQKLAEIRRADIKEATPAATGTGMILRKREDQVTTYYEQKKGRTKKGANMKGSFDHEGYAAGKAVSLHAGVGAGTNREVQVGAPPA